MHYLVFSNTHVIRFENGVETFQLLYWKIRRCCIIMRCKFLRYKCRCLIQKTCISWGCVAVLIQMFDNYRQFVLWRTFPFTNCSPIITTPFTDMPFPSINWTTLDTLTPVQLWNFLAFAKLWPCLISANAQSILPLWLLFLIPQLPPFLARYSSGSVYPLWLMVFALSGVLGSKCRHCQAVCLCSWGWIPDSYSFSSSCFLLSFTLSHMCWLLLYLYALL